MASSSQASAYMAANANDGNVNSYWEGLDNSGYPRLSFTANTGWSAAQVAEFQIFAS